MTQRRRLSRAQVERDPRREVRPGVSAATWWGDAAPMRTMPSRQALESMRAGADRERRALATAGRALVAWLIGRWRR